MSEEHTRSVTVKRTAKKKAGYAVEEREGEYFISEVPAKARVNVGDKVTGINGIKADEFEDEDDANDLIESIRIVAVPEDEIDDYEAALEEENALGKGQKKKGKKSKKEESDDEEEYEEYDRSRKAKGKGKKGKGKETALAVVPKNVSVLEFEITTTFL